MTATPPVDLVTFGCRLNIVESEAMRREALAAGHGNLTIVNTCAVTAEASRQARQAIRRFRRKRPEGRLVVTGCASEIEAAAFRAIPGIDALLPNATKTDRATWENLARSHDQERPAFCEPPPAFGPDAPGGHTRGFVEIQNGCDHRCTFCVIPFGRGISRSVPVDRVIEQVRRLCDEGAREIVLTGVDITSYGADLDGQPTLGRLVGALLRAVPDLPRLRLSSLDCIEADPLLIDMFASERRLMPHLHLSLQAGSDLILKRMKRRHSRGDAIAFCETIRAKRPEIVFGADFIAGFPTETEAMFADTLDLIEACGLTHIHVFPFSARPGTPAARMPPVPGAIIKDRAARVRDRAAGRLREHLDGQVARCVPVLMERGGKARTEDFTPVRLEGTQPAPGLIVPATITGHDGRELRATLN